MRSCVIADSHGIQFGHAGEEFCQMAASDWLCVQNSQSEAAT